MKEYEDIFGAKVDNVSNGEVENNNVENVELVEEVSEPVVEENEVQNAIESVETVFPNYSEAVEPVAPVVEEPEITDVNNVFGENVVENTEEVESPVIPNYSEPIEPVKPVEVVVEEDKNNDEENNYNPMEHPDAKIVLNKEVEETKEIDPELETMKIAQELKANSSLKFVIILGLLLLVVIFALPYLSELLG